MIDTPARRSGPGGRLLDAGGAALVGALAVWTALSAAVSGGDLAPRIALLLAATSTFVIARRVSTWRHWAIPLAVVVATGVLLLMAGGSKIVDDRPLKGPFGYANANAALFLQAAAAAAILTRLAQSSIGKGASVVAVAVFAGLTLTTRSLAAVALLVAAGAALAIGGRARASAHLFVVAGGVFLGGVLVCTVLLATTYSPVAASPVQRAAEESLSERRLALWRDAILLMGERPSLGVGPGRFQVESTTARGDDDARWAHNEFLQQGSETGAVGLGLTVVLAVWVLARLRQSPPDAITTVAALAVTALGIQACIDYVLHFAAVPLVSAALVGAAGAPRPGTSGT